MVETLFIDGNIPFYDLDNAKLDDGRIRFCVSKDNKNLILKDYKNVPHDLRYLFLYMWLYIKTDDDLIVPFKIVRRTKKSKCSIRLNFKYEYEYVIQVYGVIREGYSSKTYGSRYANFISINLSSSYGVCKELSVNSLDYVIRNSNKEDIMYGEVENIRRAIEELCEVLASDHAKLHYAVDFQSFIRQIRIAQV